MPSRRRAGPRRGAVALRSITGNSSVLLGNHGGHRRGNGGDDRASSADGLASRDKGTPESAVSRPSSRRGRRRNAGAAVTDAAGREVEAVRCVRRGREREQVRGCQGPAQDTTTTQQLRGERIIQPLS